MFFDRIIYSKLFAAAVFFASGFVAKPTAAAFAVHATNDHVWRWHDERTLHAVVVQREGRERLSVQIELPSQIDLAQTDELIWVVPIPAPVPTIHARELLDLPVLSGSSVVGSWVDDVRSMLTLMAGSQIWPLPFIVASGWKDGSIRIPAWNAPALLHREALRGASVEIVPGADVSGPGPSLAAQGVVMPAAVTAALILSAARSQSFVMLRVTSLAQLAQAIRDGNDRPVLGLEIEFPALPGSISVVPVGRSFEPRALRSLQIFAQGFVEPQGARSSALLSDHLLGRLSSSGSESERGRYTVIWTPSPTTVADTQLLLADGASRLTRFAESWYSSSLHNLFDLGTLLILFITLSITASLAAQRIYPLPHASRRRTLLLGLANLLTFLGTFVAATQSARAQDVSLRRGSVFALLSSLIFVAEVALFAWVTTLLHP
jgi:hypothetical protein